MKPARDLSSLRQVETLFDYSLVPGSEKMHMDQGLKDVMSFFTLLQVVGTPSFVSFCNVIKVCVTSHNHTDTAPSEFLHRITEEL